MSGFSHFRDIIAELPNFNAEHWLFSQHRDGYSAAYRPRYPEKTAADFMIYCETPTDEPWAGTWTLSADTACVPIMKKFKSFADLRKSISSIDT